MASHPNRSKGATIFTAAGNSPHERRRAADAAFFEDWSEWASLDNLPGADKRHGHFVANPAQHHRYYCRLRYRIGWMGGAAFELALPPSKHIEDLVRALPGARQHPALNGLSRQAYRGLRDTWFVPAEAWRELRAILPDNQKSRPRSQARLRMTGKPTIDPKVHAKIRKLDRAGHSRPAIQEQLGVSNYTVRKALDPDFLERERERQRAMGAERYAARKGDPKYQARQKAHADTDAYREAARKRMAERRKKSSPES